MPQQTITTDVKGLYYNGGLEAIRRGYVKEGDILVLNREIVSPFGRETTSVCLGSRGRAKIGYVPRGLSPRLSRIIDCGLTVEARVFSIRNTTVRGCSSFKMSMTLKVVGEWPSLSSGVVDQALQAAAGICGVYCLGNISEGKYYIGSAQDIGKRLQNHHEKLVSGLHDNQLLMDAWNRTAPEFWMAAVLEVTSSAERTAREAAWIRKNVTFGAGYNLTSDGGPGKGGGGISREVLRPQAATTRLVNDAAPTRKTIPPGKSGCLTSILFLGSALGLAVVKLLSEG